MDSIPESVGSENWRISYWDNCQFKRPRDRCKKHAADMLKKLIMLMNESARSNEIIRSPSKKPIDQKIPFCSEEEEESHL